MKELIPVIHVESINLAKYNVSLLKKIGIKKAFLISHTEKINYKKLLNIADLIKEEHPDFWLGCNFLDIKSSDVFKVLGEEIHKLDGLWIDNSFIGIEQQERKADSLYKDWKISGFKGLYFSGVAFKGCDQPLDFIEASKLAVNKMDVITTSGSKTGSAPDLEKIKKMKEAIGYNKLAIASGISYENIDTFLPYADIFLTASSIESDFGVFDEEKTSLLFKKIRDFKDE